MTRWYRAYEGTVTDAKLGEAALVAGCSRSVAIAAWHCILESCASSQRGGEYDTSPRRVALILGEPVANLNSLFDAFTELGMVENGAVTAWSRLEGDLRPPVHIWGELRKTVFARDQFTCTYCGARGSALECDHVVPISRGGTNDLSNLATSCRPCNRAKRDKLISEWLR